MKIHIIRTRFFLVVCFMVISNTNIFGQDSGLCVGNYWTEEEAYLKMKTWSGEWNDKDSWEKRGDIIKKGVITGMGLDQMPEIKGHFNPIIRNTKLMDGYIVENIAIESFPGFYVTGNIYRPTKVKGRLPAILCTHGHKSNRGLTENLQIRCGSLARMGAIVFAYDMVGMNNIQQVTHHMPISLLLQTWNSRRVLEYLLSREDVDPEQIGMTGESGGATQTLILTALDGRIKVSVPVAQVSGHFFGGCVGESGMPIHRSKGHQTNNVEIAALAAPRPMLLISDGADWTRNTPIVEYPYIQKVYALYDAPHKVANVHLPNEKHDYGYSKRAAAYVFFARHLSLSLDNLPYEDRFIESFVTILPNDQLRVFNQEYPPPEDMLMGNEAVMNYLNIDLEKVFQ
ncbi:MAG: acetylxylan esterase [Cyclobacteriaceae bacterium]